MDQLTPRIRLVDLEFLGRPHVIATAVMDTPAGIVLIDPGPSSCLDRLDAELARAGIASRDLHAVLLTHIHLDHAGASGLLVRAHPHLRVFVSERGVPHVVDPSKLVASATRIYGDDMHRLWGEIVPVPAANVTSLAGGECLSFGARRVDVAYSPGHAWHHVSYFDRDTGIAFAGDTGGIRVGDTPYVLPPTPPPDVDLAAWRVTIDRLRAWQPTGVFITHFGLKRDAPAHLDWLVEEIEYWERLAADLLDSEPDEAEQARRFTDDVLRRLTERAGADGAVEYRVVAPLQDCWVGLSRYQRKKAAA